MKALWLEPGSAPVPMTLKNDSVAVRDGPLHGHFPRYRNGAQGEERLMLAFGHYQTIPHHMKHVGGNVYRDHISSQILVFQNMDKNVAEPESQDPDFEMHDGFRCAMSFVYMHPGSPETTLRIGYNNDGECKVSWQGKTPTGWWAVNQLQPDARLPSGIDATEPVLSIRFNCKGDETQESGTVYGLLLETSHVYRAIGSVAKNGQVRFYPDDEIRYCKRWHIVLVSKVKPAFVY